ncbi:MAG: DNA-directed RNA polymerase subunit E'' [Nanoarchaeota archaeon]|nr:DNA-directed RNA polymerase subunit E'' [Nanoarchaeota archaeon]
MVKKLASKSTKELLFETEIKEKNLRRDDFTGTWQGRLHILHPDKSKIAAQLAVKKEGEYAIKVR